MEEKEIYLRDYLKVLIKQKWIVILVPVISIITTAIFVFGFTKPELQPQIYESSVTIQNGFFQTPLVQKQEGFEMIKILAEGLGSEIQFEDIPNTQYFRIRLKGGDPDLAKETCEKLADDYINENNILYNKRRKDYLDKLDGLDQRKQIIDDNINEMQNTISKLLQQQTLERTSDYKNRVNTLKMQSLDIEDSIFNINLDLAKSKEHNQIYSDKLDLLNQKKKILDDNINDLQKKISEASNIQEEVQLQMSERIWNYKNGINNFKMQKMDIESAISDINLILVNAQQFEIMSPVKVTECTIASPKPNKKTKLMLSAVLGLMGGILLAFAIENWNQPKGEN